MDTELLIREVRDAAGRVAVSLEAVEEARRAVHRAALRALVAVEGDAERERELVRVLYWDVPALPVKTIAAVIGTPSQVRALAGPGPLLGRCDVCDAEVHATSRTHRTQGTARCTPCQPKSPPAQPAYPWDAGAVEVDPWDEGAPTPEPPDWDAFDDAGVPWWAVGAPPWSGAAGS